MEDNFSLDWGGVGSGDSFGMIQAHYIYCAVFLQFMEFSKPEYWSG